MELGEFDCAPRDPSNMVGVVHSIGPQAKRREKRGQQGLTFSKLLTRAALSMLPNATS